MGMLKQDSTYLGGRVFNPCVHTLRSFLKDPDVSNKDIVLIGNKLFLVLEHTGGYDITIDYDVEYLKTMWPSDRESFRECVKAFSSHPALTQKVLAL